jgi:hypothetical protein
MLAHEVLYERLKEDEFMKKIPEALVRQDETGEVFRKILYRCFNDEDLRKGADDFVLKIPIRYGDPDASITDCIFIQMFWWARVKFIKSQPEMTIEDPLLISDAQKPIVLLYRLIQLQQKVLAEKTTIAVEEINFWKHRDYDIPSSTLKRTLPNLTLLPRLVTDIVLLSPSMILLNRFFPRFETLLQERGSDPFIQDYVFGILFRKTASQCYMFHDLFTPEGFGTEVAIKDFENLYPEICKLIIEKTSDIHRLFGHQGSNYCLQLLCNTRSNYETALKMAEMVFSNPLVRPVGKISKSWEIRDDLRPWLFLAYETVRMRKLRILREKMPESMAELTIQQVYGHFHWEDKYRHSAMMGVMDREFGREYNGKKYKRGLRRYYAAGYYLREHYFDYPLLNSLKELC